MQAGYCVSVFVGNIYYYSSLLSSPIMVYKIAYVKILGYFRKLSSIFVMGKIYCDGFISSVLPIITSVTIHCCN